MEMRWKYVYLLLVVQWEQNIHKMAKTVGHCLVCKGCGYLFIYADVKGLERLKQALLDIWIQTKLEAALKITQLYRATNQQEGLSTVRPAGLNHLCCQSHCKCVWPLNLEDYILIVSQPALQLPLTLCRPTDHLLLFPGDKSHSAAVWPFLWAGSLAVRPHNSPSVCVYSPFCPLCLVPRADLALLPIPAVTTCDILNGGVTSTCIWQQWQGDYGLLLVEKKRSCGQMFVPHVLGRFAVKGDTVLAGVSKKQKKRKKAWTERSDDVQLQL